MHFFTQTPVATPDDLKKLKLFHWAGDPTSLEIWKAAGFNPVPLPSTEIATALQTGLVEAFGAPPQVAVITQYYENAKNMTDVNWALLLGATVIKKDDLGEDPGRPPAPAAARPPREAGAKLQAEIRKSGETRRRGDEEARPERRRRSTRRRAALWRTTAESTYPRIRGDDRAGRGVRRGA